MRSFLLLLSLLVTTVAAHATPGWSGRYEFIESGTRSAAGTGIVIVHKLQVWKGARGWEAKVEADGFQTYTHLRCTGRVRGNGFDVLLQRADAGYVDAKAGQRLFSLIQTPRGLVTQWDRFGLVGRVNYPKRGRYFRRVKA